jgi:molybdenum cofactor synthesis domain-containing protein
MKFTACVITVSDRSFKGVRADASGPAVARRLAEAGFDVKCTAIVPDERPAIRRIIREFSKKADLVVTTGGTGITARDVTPEATRDVIEKELHGFGEAMRAASLKITPHAIISRATAGTTGSAIVLNLPGSPKAAVENLEAVIEAIPHSIEMLQDRARDCAGAAAAKKRRARRKRAK